MNLFALIPLTLMVVDVKSFKVLVIYPLPLKSLNILGHSIVRHLTNAGHEVTYVTVYPSKLANNCRQIDISGNSLMLDNGNPLNNISYVMESNMQGKDLSIVQEFIDEAARFTFENENFKNLLNNNNEQFDVVIADHCESGLYSGLSVLYDCPMIWAYSMGAHWHVLRLIDGPTNPAYDPDYLSLNLAPFTFIQRVEELITRMKISFNRRFVREAKDELFYKKFFEPLMRRRGRPLPNYEDVLYNASFIFGNEHIAIINQPSTPQNFKNIGGMHIEVPVKPLPKDLQELMDNSKKGVIYFSMGSFWKSQFLPKIIIMGLLKLFEELEQTVIWKFEDNLANVPKNVHIVNWAPQTSILAHPNCLFFITHGGLLSSIETIHFGVPTIGIPIYFDQFINMNKAVASGYALQVSLNYNLTNNLKTAISIMLSDDRYRMKAKELSTIYHGRPISPSAELVHWVEHVVRTRGALHLRSPALHMPLYQKLYIDLLAVLITIFIAFAVLLKWLNSRFFIKSVFRDKKTN